VYVLSLVFLLASVVALLLGLLQGGLTLVFVSIGCSVLAALFLGASVLRRASAAQTTQPINKMGVGEWTGVPEHERLSSEAQEPPASRAEGGSLAGESLVGIVDNPLAGRHRQQTWVPTVEASGAPRGVLAPDVVVLFELGTYHLLSCEQVEGRDSPDMMKQAVAKRLGYTPCGVCRPG
jgi:hypothetical protein